MMRSERAANSGLLLPLLSMRSTRASASAMREERALRVSSVGVLGFLIARRMQKARRMKGRKVRRRRKRGRRMGGRMRMRKRLRKIL